MDITIDSVLDERLELVFSGDWFQTRFPEHPVFTSEGRLLNATPLLGGDFLLEVVDRIDLRIWNSTQGALIPPRYENVDGGVIKHVDQCRILHTVLVNNSSMAYEAPGCWSNDELDNLTGLANQTYWLFDLSVAVACAIVVDQNNTNSVVTVAPCVDSFDVQVPLPAYVEGLCASASWTNKSQAAFCTVGLTRYQAAGLPLNITDAAVGDAMSQVLHMADVATLGINAALADQALRAEWGWLEDVDVVLRAARLTEPCLNETAVMDWTRWLPEIACGREFLAWSEGNSTIELDGPAFSAAWRDLRATSPCGGATSTILLLDGGPSAGCGSLLPDIRNRTTAAAGQINWTSECPNGRGVLFSQYGLDDTQSWTCGVELAYPANQTVADSWDALRAWAPCRTESMYILAPEDGVPSRLCGSETNSIIPDVGVVLDYVLQENPCGSDHPLLFAGNASSVPVVVCATAVSGQSPEWETHWAEVKAINPCGGEVAAMNGTYADLVRSAQTARDQNATPIYRWCGTEFADPNGGVAGLLDPGLLDCAPPILDIHIVAFVMATELVYACLDKIEVPDPPDPPQPCEDEEFEFDPVCNPPENPCGDGPILVFAPVPAGGDPNPDGVTVCGVEVPPKGFIPDVNELVNQINDAISGLPNPCPDGGVYAVPGTELPPICGIDFDDIVGEVPEVGPTIEQLEQTIEDNNPCDPDNGQPPILIVTLSGPPVGGCIGPIGDPTDIVDDVKDAVGEPEPPCDPFENLPDEVCGVNPWEQVGPPNEWEGPGNPGTCLSAEVCVEYTLNGENVTDASLGVPAAFGNGSILWLVGAPLVGVGPGDHPHVQYTVENAGFIGSFAAFVFNPNELTDSAYDYVANVQHIRESQSIVETPWFNLTTEGHYVEGSTARYAATSLNSQVVQPNDVRFALGGPQVPPSVEGLPDTTIHAAFLSTQVYDEHRVTAQTTHRLYSIGQGNTQTDPGSGTPWPSTLAGSMPSLGWVINATHEAASVSSPAPGGGESPGSSLTSDWASLARRRAAVVYGWGASHALDVAIQPMPRILQQIEFSHAEESGSRLFALEAKSEEAIHQLYGDTFDTFVVVARPPLAFNWSALVEPSDLSGLAATRIVGLAETGPPPEGDPLPNAGGTMDVRVELENAVVDVDMVEADLFVDATFVNKTLMDTHKAVIPFVKALVTNPKDNSNTSTIANSIRVFGPDGFEASMSGLAYGKVDTSLDGFSQDPQYDLRFTNQGQLLVVVKKKVDGDEKRLTTSVVASCAHYRGKLYLEKETLTSGSPPHQGQAKVSEGAIDLVIDQTCQAPAPRHTMTIYNLDTGNWEGAVHLENIDSFQADFHFSDHLGYYYDPNSDTWIQEDGDIKDVNIQMDSADGATLTANLTGLGISLVTWGSLIEELAVDFNLTWGWDYTGTNIPNDIDGYFGWHMNRDSSGLYFRNEEKVEVELHDLAPVSDFLDEGIFEIHSDSGIEDIAQLICNEGPFELRRTGESWYTCLSQVHLQTLGDQ